MYQVGTVNRMEITGILVLPDGLAMVTLGVTPGPNRVVPIPCVSLDYPQRQTRSPVVASEPARYPSTAFSMDIGAASTIGSIPCAARAFTAP